MIDNSSTSPAVASDTEIVTVDCFPALLPLRKPLVMATYRIDDGPVLFVRVRTRGGAEGWGEAAASPIMSGETLTGMQAAVRDLIARRKQELISALPDEKASEVAVRMKQYGISQLPVIERESKRAIGMVHETDLLEGLLNGKVKYDAPVELLMTPIKGTVALETPVSKLKDIFNQGHVAVVMQGDRTLAVVTKIDLIEFLGSRVG